MQNKIRQVVIGKFGKKRPSKVPIKHLNAAVFLTTYTEIEKKVYRKLYSSTLCRNYWKQFTIDQKDVFILDCCYEYLGILTSMK